MIVRSPIHSFVDFENRLEGVVLPLASLYSIAFQYYYERGSIEWSERVLMELVSVDRQTVLMDFNPTSAVIQEGCSWTTLAGLPADETAFPLIIAPNRILPEGEYLTMDELQQAFALIGLQMTGEPQMYCCSHTSNSYAIPASGTSGDTSMTLTFERGSQYCYFLIDASNPAGFEQAVPVGGCFRFSLYNMETATRVTSNVFQRQATDDYLTLFEYMNNEPAFDFVYGGANRVYLPAVFRNPQYSEKRKVYKKSNGQYKLLSATIEKEYEMATAYLPDVIHDRINVMLAHDSVTVTADNLSGAILKKEGADYGIDWQDVSWRGRLPVAQAKTKVVQAFEGRNSNCDRNVGCVLSLGCLIYVTGLRVSLADIIGGNQYYYVDWDSTTGDAVQSARLLVKRAGESTYTDITTQAGTNIIVAIRRMKYTLNSGDSEVHDIRVHYYCSPASMGAEADATYTEEAVPECNGVTITSVSLPDGTEGAAYSATIPLTGTAPVTLSGITKPAWMNIAVQTAVDNESGTVRLTGTPTAAATGVTVAFTLNNCGGSTATYSDTIDIAAAQTGGTTFRVKLSSGNWIHYMVSVSLNGAPITLADVDSTTKEGSTPAAGTSNTEVIMQLTDEEGNPVNPSTVRLLVGDAYYDFDDRTGNIWTWSGINAEGETFFQITIQ